jgi:hypothetical protein
MRWLSVMTFQFPPMQNRPIGTDKMKRPEIYKLT